MNFTKLLTKLSMWRHRNEYWCDDIGYQIY